MGKTVKVVVILLIVTAVFVDCHSVLKRAETRAEKIEKERETYGKRMRAYMDQSVDPCDDFYQYSCGNYFKVKKVKHGVDQTDVFGIVTDEMNEALHDIFTKSLDFGNYSVVEKVRNLYKSCMDVDIFSYPPGDPYLKVIDSLGGWPALDDSWTPEKFDWFNATSVLASYNVDSFIRLKEFMFSVTTSYFGVGGLLNSRPLSRSYIVNQKLISKILSIYGVPSKKAKRIFAEIVYLSKQWWKFYKKYYDKFSRTGKTTTIAGLKEKVPEIDWDRYFEIVYGQKLNSSIKVHVEHAEYLKRLPSFFTSKNKKFVANYMFIKFLFELHEEFGHPQYHKDFCIDVIQKLMGDVVTAMYINSPHHKETVEDEVMSMAAYMRSAFKAIVKDIDWMDMETKRKALVKLRDMRMIIGDVELTLDLKGLEEEYKDFPVEPGSSYFENNLRLKQYKVRRNCPSIEEVPDTEYDERYQSEVNAYYAPWQNKMILPAGILRKPFFDPNLPKSYNFGAMGANIIGHEMTHGFDSSGRHFDHNGDTEDWWSPESDSAFEERAKCFVDQYDSYRIEEINTNVEGNTTLGENIADTGGVRQGFIAYHKWLNANQNFIDMASETLPTLNLTNDQLYFVAYAQTYCGSYKRKAYETRSGDPHAVNKFRVIGSVSNFDEFGKQFNCPLGSTMNPEKKCVLW